jgi:hypothetical protein
MKFFVNGYCFYTQIFSVTQSRPQEGGIFSFSVSPVGFLWLSLSLYWSNVLFYKQILPNIETAGEWHSSFLRNVGGIIASTVF